MKKLLTVITLTMLLAGCATTAPQPPPVELAPNQHPHP
jgi:PBP1b-binding outer membrane lipoprotein LpoB